MAVWFISRHPGALDWIAKKGVKVDHIVSHLNSFVIQSGDTVIGTVPVHIASQICEAGATFFELVLNLPRELRGRELSSEDLDQCKARLEQFHVTKL